MIIKRFIHDVALASFLVLIVLTLFISQYMISDMHQDISGQVIRIGEGDQEDSSTPSTNDPATTDPRIRIGTQPDPRFKTTHLFPRLTPNQECWKTAGLTDEDIRIAGNLFDNTKCVTPKTKKSISTNIKDNCLIINIEGDVITDLCMKDKKPSISIKFKDSEGTSPQAYKQPRNYTIPFFIFLFICSLLFMSRDYYYAFRFKRKTTEEQEKEDQVDVRYIETAPLFKRLLHKQPTDTEISQIHHKLLSEQPIKEAHHLASASIPEEDISTTIKEFNILAKKTSTHLKEGKLENARQTYLKLFPLYSELYNTLDIERRRQIQEVIKYLHDQMNIMTKSRDIVKLIKEAYQEVKHYKIKALETKPVETQELKGTQQETKEINYLRDMLQKGNYKEIKRTFQKLGHQIKKSEKAEKIIGKAWGKQDVLEGIEHVHQKLKDKHFEKIMPHGITKLKQEIEELRRLLHLSEKKKKNQKK